MRGLWGSVKIDPLVISSRFIRFAVWYHGVAGSSSLNRRLMAGVIAATDSSMGFDSPEKLCDARYLFGLVKRPLFHMPIDS
jgi:hypothetical protein